MNEEFDTCDFCREDTTVSRITLHALNKPKIGAGHSSIRYCYKCSLVERILCRPEKLEKELNDAVNAIYTIRLGAMDDKQFKGSVELMIITLIDRIAPRNYYRGKSSTKSKVE